MPIKPYGELTPCHGTIWHPLEGPWLKFVDRCYININIHVSISMDWFHSFHFPFIRIAHSTGSLISIPHLGIPYHAENTPRMAPPDRREQLAEVGENTTQWKTHVNIEQHISISIQIPSNKASWQPPILTGIFVGDDFVHQVRGDSEWSIRTTEMAWRGAAQKTWRRPWAEITNLNPA